MKAKINPLEQLIAIYGKKFHEALKAGDVTKAIRMCADYQDPDTGRTLEYEKRVKAFAFRVSMESLKVPEISGVVIGFKPESFYSLINSREIAMMATMDRDFHQNGAFKYMGVTMKRVDK